MSYNKDQIHPIVPEPEYDNPKEVYAFFGLAAYSVQLLEQGILNLLVGLHISGLEVPTWADVQKLYDEGDLKTLGRLIKAVRELISFDPSIEGQLAEALRRNWGQTRMALT